MLIERTPVGLRRPSGEASGAPPHQCPLESRFVVVRGSIKSFHRPFVVCIRILIVLPEPGGRCGDGAVEGLLLCPSPRPRIVCLAKDMALLHLKVGTDTSTFLDGVFFVCLPTNNASHRLCNRGCGPMSCVFLGCGTMSIGRTCVAEKRYERANCAYNCPFD